MTHTPLENNIVKNYSWLSRKKKMGEWNEDEIGMEMKVKMKSEEWKMRMKV